MELNQPGYYKTLIVEDTEFDPDDYGNKFYSVVFEGDASSHLWKAKNKPETNTEYYGHFEKSRSGKAVIFKRDKEPEDESRPSNAQASKPPYKDNSKNITLGLVWKVLIGIQGVPENDDDFAKFFETVNAHVTELILMGEKLREEE